MTGRPSIPEAAVINREAAAYWLPRSSRGMTAEYGATTAHTNAGVFAIVAARQHLSTGRKETRHGQGSDAQQQGKEETEGREEHQEGRRDALAVLIRQDADAGRPKRSRQEGLRPLVHPIPVILRCEPLRRASKDERPDCGPCPYPSRRARARTSG